MEERSDSTTLVLRRVVAHGRPRVFEAFTRGELMSAWFCAVDEGTAEVRADFREGGAFEIDMKGPRGEVAHHHGRYLEIVPDRRIVMTWTSPAVENTTVSIELEEVEGGCRITLSHRGLPTEWLERHEKGWGVILKRLEASLGG
jgi:uncharacterized protein YndB with AHSA1/START domain